MQENKLFPNRYLTESVIPDTREAHARIVEAMTASYPTMRVLLVSDITDEASSTMEMNGSRIQVVGALPRHEYIDPYSRQVNSNNTIWYGIYNKDTGAVRSAGNTGNLPENEVRFSVAYSDILNYVYAMDTGAALPVYNLFAGHIFDLLPEHHHALKLVGANAYSPNAAISRYLGGIDSIAASVRNYCITYKTYETRRDAGEDIKFLDVPPINGADPRTPEELFSLLTLFASTWCRANMVVEYLNSKLSAKNPDEAKAVRNNLVLRWWLKAAPDRYTKEEMYQLARRNGFTSMFMTLAKIIDFSGKATSEDQLAMSIELIDQLHGMMLNLNDGIRGKLGRSGHHGISVREMARKACTDIIDQVA